MRKKENYRVLDRMPKAYTINSFQGQEGKISVVIISTRSPNPGFTGQKNRLNVALSRQTSGLAVFSDINVVGQMVDRDGKPKNRAKNRGKERQE
ncbi:hypothetical protein PT974_04937 [Cladobotryum mycophilum]|uniref:DNA2/NAM7 helicase-like C-terminal domain-containing protein n=1 Tax=Cladobotryum mycophilum TaxID=491253 RepID=A0ABR0SQL4_9HYPO